MSTSPGSSSTSRTSTSPSPTRSVTRWLLIVGGRYGQREHESCPVSVLRVQPDFPTIMLDNLAAHGEPDAGPGIRRPVMQALEDHEDAVRVLRLDADPGVGDGELPEAIVTPRDRDLDDWRPVAPELDGVADQVLEQRRQQRELGADEGQFCR